MPVFGGDRKRPAMGQAVKAMDLRFYVSRFFRQVHWFLLVLALFGAAGFVAAKVLPTVFVASALLVVESDVVIKQDTISRLLDDSGKKSRAGLVGSVTVDEAGVVNFPYLKFKGVKEPVITTHRSLSFCCTLFSLDFLKSYDFAGLDEAKDWYDTFISKKSLELGFENRVLINAPVWHRPHASRPWKQLKYTNPLKYYFLKFWKGMDKI